MKGTENGFYLFIHIPASAYKTKTFGLLSNEHVGLINESWVIFLQLRLYAHKN